MSQLHDELAARAMLADLTEGQPAAPADRHGAVRRRAVLHRRRQFAAIAAVIAVLAAAAATIPLRLLHAAQPAPQTRSRDYRVSEQRPDPSSHSGLIASGMINGKRWRVALDPVSSASNECITDDAGHMNCDASPPPRSNYGDLADFGGTLGPAAYYGSVRGDVAYLRVVYTNGQILTVYPVPVLSARVAPVAAFPAPYPAAVTRIVAYSAHGELGYAIPFTRFGGISTAVWLRPGQAALPRPATYPIGSGIVDGRQWHETAYIGPWGFCYAGGLATGCGRLNWLGHQQAAAVGAATGSHPATRSWDVVGQTAPQVAVLVLTTAHHRSEQIRPVSDGFTGMFAYVSSRSDPVVRWAVYDAHGRKLGQGHDAVP